MAMMSPKGGSGAYRPLAEINVTPLVDVMLVLLIIFMVTAPMLASGMKVNLPQAKQVQPLDPKAPIIVTIGKDSTINLGADVVERDKLIGAIQAKLGSDITQTIHLRGDKEAVYGDVVAIMDLLATNGLTHIAIVADPHAKETAKPDLQLKPAGPVSPVVQVQADADAKAVGSVSPVAAPGAPASAPTPATAPLATTSSTAVPSTPLPSTPVPSTLAPSPAVQPSNVSQP